MLRVAGPGCALCLPVECWEQRPLPELGALGPRAWVWKTSHPQGSSELEGTAPGNLPAAGVESPAWAWKASAPGAPGPGSLACESCPGPGLTYSVAPPVHGHRPASHCLQDVQQGSGVSLLYDAWGRKEWVVTLPDAGGCDIMATQTTQPVPSPPLRPGSAAQGTEGPGDSRDGMQV